MSLADRVNLIVEKIKLAISAQIAIMNRRETKVRYLVNKGFFTEMRIVMSVIDKGDIINFKIFNDQKPWEMVRYFDTKFPLRALK